MRAKPLNDRRRSWPAGKKGPEKSNSARLEPIKDPRRPNLAARRHAGSFRGFNGSGSRPLTMRVRSPGGGSMCAKGQKRTFRLGRPDARSSPEGRHPLRRSERPKSAMSDRVRGRRASPLGQLAPQESAAPLRQDRRNRRRRRYRKVVTRHAGDPVAAPGDNAGAAGEDREVRIA